MNTAIAQNTTPTNVAAAFHAAVGAAEKPVVQEKPAQAIGKISSQGLKEIGLPEVPSIVIRNDFLQNSYVFLADTQDTTAGTLKVWNPVTNTVSEVPKAFYQSTFKAEGDTLIQGIVQKFSKASGFKQVQLRQRLFKGGSAVHKDSEGKADTVDVEEVKAQIKAEIARLMKVVDELL